jgi:hypothetical protein
MLDTCLKRVGADAESAMEDGVVGDYRVVNELKAQKARRGKRPREYRSPVFSGGEAGDTCSIGRPKNKGPVITLERSRGVAEPRGSLSVVAFEKSRGISGAIDGNPATVPKSGRAIGRAEAEGRLTLVDKNLGISGARVGVSAKALKGSSRIGRTDARRMGVR